jgi:ABC-type thiamin/hydroxymethylpyrimidine transport system permease subunit
MFQKFKRWLRHEVEVIGAALKKAEAWIRSTIAVVVGGGSAALLEMYQSGKHFELTAQHLLEAKTRFIGGALVALVMVWAKSPKQGPQPATVGDQAGGLPK